MKWEGNRESDNVEDVRGNNSDNGRGLFGGGFKIGTIVIAILVSYFFNINPMTVINLLNGMGSTNTTIEKNNTPTSKKPPVSDHLAKFASVILADTEDVWGSVYQQNGKVYPRPKLRIFSGTTPTACGRGQSAMGPFYCPGDQKIYIDLAFYETLHNQLGAPGEFAQAYVIAHEVGHHVQHVQGISTKVDQMRRRVSEKDANALSVRLELQADCYAGLWAKKANETRQILQTGDIESAMNAAAKIGDDALQRTAKGEVRPDSFTHGSSEQRMYWFNVGLQTGSVQSCDTFAKRHI